MTYPLGGKSGESYSSEEDRRTTDVYSKLGSKETKSVA